MSKRKKPTQRASSSAKRRTSSALNASSPKLRPRKKSWLSTWGFVVISAIMVIVLGASVLTFINIK